MKLLVVAPSWIGDTIIAQPMLRLIKLRDPGVHIDVLAADWCAPLLRRMQEVDGMVLNPFGHGQFRLRQRRALGRQLAASGYDAAYVLPNSWKSALVPWFAGIPRRIGYRGEARYGLLNERHVLDELALPLQVQRYAALVGALPEELPRPRLESNREQQRDTRSKLGLPENGEPVVFCPGAEFGPAKRWPAEHYATLAKRIASVADPVWIIGSARDKPVGDDIERLADGKALNLCGRSSLDQAIDLIATARCVVSNDSGLMHVAAALDRPLVALYGSSSPAYTPPLSPRAKIIASDLDCSPCFKRECPLGHLDCLNKLDPKRVADAMDC